MQNIIKIKFPGVLVCLFLSYGTLYAQAKPSYTQYVLNNYILNPAVTGIENYTDVKISNRNQWTNIEGAPVTTYISMHGAIGKSDMATSATSYRVPGENPRGNAYWREYTAPEAHHGIGFQAVNDKAGYFNRWSVNATYAYHLPLGPKLSLAGGFSAGISSVNLDRSKIDFADLDPNDPAIGFTNGDLKRLKPEVGVGLWLYSDRYYAGVSVLNIIPGKYKFVKDDKYGTFYNPNGFLTAGYRIEVSDDLNLIPSVMLQYWQPNLLGVHGSAKLQYRDLLWVGGNYRYGDFLSGYGGMAGINISNTLNLSYAYEVATTNKLRTYTGNTHEFMVGFLIGNKYGDNCPRNVW